MIFQDLANGFEIFLDANVLVYHFSGHPKYGLACTELVERIERHEGQGFTSTHCLADVAHRLMTLEAMGRLGWPAAGVAARLRKHHAEIPSLVLFQQALAKIPQLGIQSLLLDEATMLATPALSRQYELLTGDASIVAVMQARNLRHLASVDADFDRVPGLTRYAPI